MTGEEIAAWATGRAEQMEKSAARAKDKQAKLVLLSKAGTLRHVARRAVGPPRDTDPKP